MLAAINATTPISSPGVETPSVGTPFGSFRGAHGGAPDGLHPGPNDPLAINKAYSSRIKLRNKSPGSNNDKRPRRQRWRAPRGRDCDLLVYALVIVNSNFQGIVATNFLSIWWFLHNFPEISPFFFFEFRIIFL